MWGATEQNIERLVVATLLIKYWLRGGGGFKLILRPTPILSNYTYYIKYQPEQKLSKNIYIKYIILCFLKIFNKL